MRRHAKASSAGSTFGSGKLVVVLAVAIAATLAFATAASAGVVTPTTTIGPITAVTGDSVHVTGTVEPGTYPVFWSFETSSDGVNWSGFEERAEGPNQVGETAINVSRTLTGLHGGTHYFVRLAAMVEFERPPFGQEYFSPEPNPTFTTSPVAAPAVLSVDDASSASYTSADVSGEVERPAGGESAFDVNCRFEYVSDEQFTGSGFDGAAQTACDAPNPVTAAGPSPVSAELSGLANATTYHFRLVAENAGGVDSQEAANTFTTLAVPPPTVTIDPVATFAATTAHFSGTINTNTPVGNPSDFAVNWRFVCHPGCPGPNGLSQGELPGGQISADHAAPLHSVEVNATGLEPNTDYEVELVASNAGDTASAGPQSFETDPLAPTVETLPAFALGNGTEALVGGWVNAKNSATTYWVEYGTSEDYGRSAPLSDDGDAGSAGEAKIFTQRIDGLTPGTTYHFRLVAENAVGKIEGKDMAFESTPAAPAETCSNGQLRSENSSTELPDCRAYEQVSPVDKNGYDAGTAAEQPSYVAAADGSAFDFESFGAFADSVGASTINSYLSRRGESGWTTQALTPPLTPKPNIDFSNFQYFTPDLSQAVVRATKGPALAPGATPDADNYYLRDNRTGTYQTLNIGKTGSFGFYGASAGAKHVLFGTSASLTPDAPVGIPNLYDWSNGEVRLVGIEPGPDETPMPGGSNLLSDVGTGAHAISEDGSRVVFNGLEDLQLYLREDGQTVKVSASHRATPDPDSGVARFQGASADTSKIFFIDRAPLTEDALPGTNLYLYDADAETLTNLTADPVAGVPVAEGVAGISEDGSYVYFRSPTQFQAGYGNSPEGLEILADNSNLYLWHDGAISFVAFDPGDGNYASQGFHTRYRLTADGRYLTFQTSNRLTAYDNTDAVTGQPDSEVYRYDAVAKELSCVSCSPDGQPPHGASNFPEPPKRPTANPQPGAVSDGSVFFNSVDALVPNDVNGKEDVYEWKDGRPHLISSGSSGDASYYASASKSGADVFFATREQLVATDKDQELDVYDAHVGGGFPKPTQVSRCEGAEACRGPASSAPGFTNPASGSLSTTPPPSPRVQRLKAALRACKHKPKKKKARAKCRKTARKRFTKAGRAH